MVLIAWLGWAVCLAWWVGAIAYDMGLKRGADRKRRELVEGLDYMLETGQVVILTKIEHTEPPSVTYSGGVH